MQGAASCWCSAGCLGRLGQPKSQEKQCLTTWTPLRRGNNELYLARMAKLAAQKRWTKLLAAFKDAVAKVPPPPLPTPPAPELPMMPLR